MIWERAKKVKVALVDTRKGIPSLKVSLDDGTERAIHSLYDPEVEARRLVDNFGFDGKGLVVVLGLGLGYHVAELLRRFPEAEVIVVEGMRDIYDLALKAGVIDESSRVRSFIGLSPEEALKGITRVRLSKGMSSFRILLLPSEVSTFPAYYNPILSALKSSLRTRLWERLRYPKFKEERVRVALIDCGYFLTREVERAIKRLGYRVFCIPVKKGEQGEAIVSRLIEAIVRFRPDFLLTINHLGFDEEGELTHLLKSIEMPVASWYVDSPDLIIKAHKRNVSPYTSIFLWDKSFIRSITSFGFEHCYYLPLGTDERVFRPITYPKRRLKAYRCDVGFVGNSMVGPVDEYLSKLKKEYHPLIDKVADMLFNSKRTDTRGLTPHLYKDLKGILEGLSIEEKAQIEGLSQKERMDLEGAILWKATLNYRLSCIRMLKGFDVRIHGDKGWNVLLNSNYRLGPPLHYYNELPLFYNSCTINFNTTSLQMPEAVNQRVFDVPACGGFLITDHQRAIEELFEVGSEVITYRDPEEIRGLVRFYMEKESLRNQIAVRAYQRVLKEHTYTHRVSEIVRIMKGLFA